MSNIRVVKIIMKLACCTQDFTLILIHNVFIPINEEFILFYLSKFNIYIYSSNYIKHLISSSNTI